MSTRKTTLFYAVLIAIASVAVGMVIAARLDLSSPSDARPVNVPVANTAPLSDITIDATTFRNIAKVQIPTVVNIETAARARSRDTDFLGDLFGPFLGDPNQRRRGAPRGAPQEDEPMNEGRGTGFIIDKAGYILTNNHVVEDADEIYVRLFGGGRNERYAAKVIGRDVLTDSALIQVTEMPAAPLQEAKFGDSNQVFQGDWVMAIGNPFGLGHTVTVGVISATGREFPVASGRWTHMLQTDAPINPGNSGGPLLNIRGEVVGMNTAIYTSRAQQSNLGIGFATPINSLRELVPQLRTGKVVRGVLGVSVSTDFTRSQAQALGVPNGQGALVTIVLPGGAAAKAGIQPGDVIVEFNGRPVADNSVLVEMVMATRPGTTAPVTIIRDKQRRTINATVQELDLDAESNSPLAGRQTPDVEPEQTGFGMTVAPITPDVARQVELPRNRGGAVISGVERRGAAAIAGLQSGDIILEVNRQPVSNPGQVTKALQSVQPGQSAFLLVWRDGAEVFAVLTKR
jgi:serine protease Do